MAIFFGIAGAFHQGAQQQQHGVALLGRQGSDRFERGKLRGRHLGHELIAGIADDFGHTQIEREAERLEILDRHGLDAGEQLGNAALAALAGPSEDFGHVALTQITGLQFGTEAGTDAIG